MSNIKISIPLHDKQKEVLAGAKRFTIFRAGRRLGKSYLAIYWLMKRALLMPGSVNWMVCQDVATGKELSVPSFLRMCPPELIKTYNKSNRVFELYNGATVYFKSSETQDSLRGRGIDTLVCEEYAFWPSGKSTWYEILRPQLADKMGHALLISSPNGSNWARQLETEAVKQLSAGSKDWAIFTGTIFDNPFITRDEIEAIRASTPELTWRQEYLAEYVDEIGLVYWETNPLQNYYDIPPKHTVVSTVRGIDWGLGDNTACAWIHMLADGRALVYQEHVANNLDATEQAKRIITATGPTHIQLSIMDKSCWNRDAGLDSVAKRFGRAGIDNLRPGTGDFDGSVSDMKALLAVGKVLVNRRCVNLIRAIESWQHGSHEPDILAATRYGIDGLVRSGKLLAPIRQARPKTIQDVIRQEAEMQRRIDRINRHRPGNGVSMRVYNRLSD